MEINKVNSNILISNRRSVSPSFASAPVPYSTSPNPYDKIRLYRSLIAIQPRIFQIGQIVPFNTQYSNTLQAIPDINTIDKTKNWIFDARSADLSSFDLGDKSDILRFADFDSKTVFPTGNKAPKNFNPQQVLESNKDPGLNIRKLHENGYTGKGVRIAIIDQPLPINHEEYKDRIIHYEQIGYEPQKIEASMHGPSVTSILAGKSVGVAPEADVVYFAASNTENGKTVNKNYIAAMKKILKMNESLPPNKKISAVSVSWGFNQQGADFKEVTDIIKQLEDNGVFVISTALHKTHGLDFTGLNRDPQKDPNDPNSYSPGLFWSNIAERVAKIGNNLLVPMDHRTTASFTGENDYVHYNNGGLSWSVPYITGLYALAKQADSTITPQKFWQKALETGTPLKLESGTTVGQIANPVELINSLKS